MSYIHKNLIFRQLFDQDTCTYTYLLGDSLTGESIIIDPVKTKIDRDLKIVKELDLKLKYSLETHLHADHITGASDLRSVTGAKVAISKEAGVKGADVLLEDRVELSFGAFVLQALATPGHTNSCMCFVLRQEGVQEPLMVFTGDTLFIRGTGRTDFQQGCSKMLYESVVEKLFTLESSTLVFPGHDYNGCTCSTIAEEMRLNPRLGQGKTKEEFVKIMDELKLAHPKNMKVAVPANMVCGA